MRNASFFPLAFLFLASSLLAQVDVEYDESADATTVSVLAVGGAKDDFTLKASFVCPGDHVCVPAAVQMIFATLNRHPKYRANYQVTLVLDKDVEVRDLRTRHLEGKTPAMYQGALYEYIVCDTPTEKFLSVVAAKRVDYRVGSAKGRLSQKQLAALEALAERIEAATGN